jgi:hypothetical protein
MFAMKITVKKLIKAFIPYGFIAIYRYFESRKNWGNKNNFVWLMTENEQTIFTQYVKNAKLYLEFGLGGSTIAALKNGGGKVYSVESSKDWIQYMEKKYKIISLSKKSERLCLIHADIGNTRNGGYPIISNNENNFDCFLNYSKKIFEDYPETKNADVVLVDGRFRIACCLSVLLENKNNPVIMFHDFWLRPQYHAVKKFIEIIDRVDSMMVCKKKDNISNAEILNVFDNFKYVSE